MVKKSLYSPWGVSVCVSETQKSKWGRTWFSFVTTMRCHQEGRVDRMMGMSLGTGQPVQNKTIDRRGVAEAHAVKFTWKDSNSQISCTGWVKFSHLKLQPFFKILNCCVKKKSRLDVFLLLKDICIKLLISSGIGIYSVSIYDRIQIKEANYSVELTWHFFANNRAFSHPDSL